MVNLVKKLMGKTPQKKVLNNNSILLVGLWNPDKKYKNTRHNIGADTLLTYIEKKGTTFKTHKSGMYRSADISINDTEATILTPMVSMNYSGDSVRDYLKNTNIAHDNVVIIYDDIDLAFGRLRLKQGSSDGGHNGIKYIDRNINKDKEEVEFIIEEAIEVIEVFSTSREEAVKKASERRIIDVI